MVTVDWGLCMTKSPERLRSSASLRNLVQEHSLSRNDLILPVFVTDRSDSIAINAMPGVQQWSLDGALKYIETNVERGIRSFILFGIVDAQKKDSTGSHAWHEETPVIQLLAKCRAQFGADLNLIADACFCEYTDHGHCGVMCSESQNRKLEDSLANLNQLTVRYAQAGANIIAPSGMLDGMIASMRAALDKESYQQTALMSYAVKYASAFYGPFREAAENAPTFGDRKRYQMNPANRREATREIELDVAEGADMLLVKPGMPCLDIVRDCVEKFSLPVGAYQVSGEYSMIEAAAKQGWVDAEAVHIESLLAMKRAGASFMITYWADRAANIL